MRNSQVYIFEICVTPHVKFGDTSPIVSERA